MSFTFRCSGLDATFACNGRIILMPLMQAREAGGAWEGTLIHYLTAKKLIEDHKAIPPEGGLPPPDVPEGYTLPAFSAWIVDWNVRLVTESIPADWALMVEVPLAYEYTLPRPVWVPVKEIHGEIPPDAIRRTRPDGIEEVLVTHVTVSGHIDALGISPDGQQAHGIDYKTGQVGADPADNSWQAGGYMGLVRTAWEVTACKFTMAQPRIDEEATGIPRVSTVEADTAKLDALNTAIAENICKALENRYETNSGLKQCRYCPVGWRCPSIQGDLKLMKATLTPEIIESLKGAPNDGALGDFVITARSLTGPMESADELLKERIAVNGYVDAASGTRITIKTKRGKYKIVNPKGAWEAVNEVVGPDKMPEVITYSKDKVVDAIAAVRGVPKSGKSPVTAQAIWDSSIAPNMQQDDVKMLVFSQ